LKWTAPNEEGIIDFLVKEHGFKYIHNDVVKIEHVKEFKNS
jgi:hypothetical protein